MYAKCKCIVFWPASSCHHVYHKHLKEEIRLLGQSWVHWNSDVRPRNFKVVPPVAQAVTNRRSRVALLERLPTKLELVFTQYAI